MEDHGDNALGPLELTMLNIPKLCAGAAYSEKAKYRVVITS